jgi:hypothetical protein
LSCPAIDILSLLYLYALCIVRQLAPAVYIYMYIYIYIYSIFIYTYIHICTSGSCCVYIGKPDYPCCMDIYVMMCLYIIRLSSLFLYTVYVSKYILYTYMLNIRLRQTFLYCVQYVYTCICQAGCPCCISREYMAGYPCCMYMCIIYIRQGRFPRFI